MAAVLGLVVLVPATARSDDGSQAAEVCIGVIAPLSGPHKRLGKAVVDAVELASADAGPAVVAVTVDTRGTESGATRAVDKLAANPCVVAIVGPVGWRESRAAAEAAQRHRLPIVPLSAEHDLEKIGDHVFRSRPSILDQTDAMAALALGDLDIKRFAVLHPDDALGRRAAERFFESVRRGGGHVMALATYKAGETNVDKAVEEVVGKRMPRLKSKKLSRPPVAWRRHVREKGNTNFEAIFIPDTDRQVVVAARFLEFHDAGGSGDEGRGIQLLGLAMMGGEGHINAGGKTAGALYPDVFARSGDQPGVEAFVQRWVDAYERQPTEVDAQVFDVWRILGSLAVQPVQPGTDTSPSARRARLRSAMIAMKPRQVLTGKRWFPEDGTPGCEFRLWVVDSDGRITSTDP